MSSKGILYIVATPIGNLGDITLRALEILKTVDLIAAEDTRRAAILLKKYNVATKVVSYYEEIEEQRSDKLLALLKSGQKVALISDAGTPGISDPGYPLVQKALQAEIRIIPIPGASALLSALVVSGLPTDRFTFEGFLPKKKGRQTRLRELSQEPRTMIFFESPYRIVKTLQDLQTFCGERRGVVGRELTKVHEEVRRGTLRELIAHYATHKRRGEFVILVEGFHRRLRKKQSQ